MIFSAVFLIGFSTLAFEVLLTRIFSIGQWNRPVWLCGQRDVPEYFQHPTGRPTAVCFDP
jgi:hypothetical protein